MKHSHPLLMVLVVLVARTPTGILAQPPSPEDVRREVGQTRDKLFAFFNNLEVSYRSVYERTVQGRREREEAHGVFRLAGPCRSLEKYNSQDGRKSIRAYNSKYSFFMGRSKARKQDELFQYDRMGAFQTPVVDELDVVVQRFLGAAQTMMYYYSLADVLESRGPAKATLRSVEASAVEGRSLVKVLFDRIEGGKAYPCWAMLDPANHWAVVEAVVQWPWGEDVQTVEYNAAIKEVPFPKRVVYVKKVPGKGITEREEWVFNDPTPCTASEEAFTLTAYGLPEVSQQHWGLRGLFLALSGLGFAALLAAYLRRRRAQRRASTGAIPGRGSP